MELLGLLELGLFRAIRVRVITIIRTIIDSIIEVIRVIRVNMVIRVWVIRAAPLLR
jgi:hypothetical protein